MSRKSKANKSKKAQAKKTEQARNTEQAKETEPAKKTEPVRLIEFPSDFDIYQRDGEEFQELVNSVFDRESSVGIESRFWLCAIERSHHLPTDYLTAQAPELLKEFLNRFMFGDIGDFIIAIRIFKGVLPFEMILKGGTSVEDNEDLQWSLGFWRIWRAIKIATYIMLNMKAALNRRREYDHLTCTSYEWRSSNFTNDWGYIPNIYISLGSNSPPVPAWDWISEPGPYHRAGRFCIEEAKAPSKFRQYFHLIIDRCSRLDRIIDSWVNLAAHVAKKIKKARNSEDFAAADELSAYFDRMKNAHFRRIDKYNTKINHTIERLAFVSDFITDNHARW